MSEGPERRPDRRGWDVIPSDIELPVTEPIDMIALIAASSGAHPSR